MMIYCRIPSGRGDGVRGILGERRVVVNGVRGGLDVRRVAGECV
jgi:hypothetical protein